MRLHICEEHMLTLQMIQDDLVHTDFIGNRSGIMGLVGILLGCIQPIKNLGVIANLVLNVANENGRMDGVGSGGHFDWLEGWLEGWKERIWEGRNVWSLWGTPVRPVTFRAFNFFQSKPEIFFFFRMNISEIQPILEMLHSRTNDLYSSMHRQEHPHYGRVLHILNEFESMAHLLTDYLSLLENWITQYSQQKTKIWIRRMLETGTDLIQYYKEITPSSYHSFQRDPTEAQKVTGFCKEIQNIYKGDLDTDFESAYRNAFSMAQRIRTEYRKVHEGECMGGLICLLCDGDEFDLTEKCRKDADLPNNIFWNRSLQKQFLAEMDSRASQLTVPDDDDNDDCDLVSEDPSILPQCTGGTPFQYAKALVTRVWLKWDIRSSADDYSIFKVLRKKLPYIKQAIPFELAHCQEIRAMF